MTISSEIRKAGPYEGNDVTTSFPFSFKVFSAGDVVVVRTNASGVETSLTIGTDYSVTLNADQDTSPGGSIVLPAALASGFLLTLTSSVPNLQPVMLTNQGGFYPRVINDALDRLTILMQQLSEKLSRALSVPISSAVSSALPPPAANHVLGWDAAGMAVTNLMSLAEGTTVSSAMHPVVTAASLASARAAMGVGIGTDVQPYHADTIAVAPGPSGNTLVSNGLSWDSVAQPRQKNAIAATVAGGALTISAGNMAVDFRSTTRANGSVATVVGAPADLVVSNGSTLGTWSGLTRLEILAVLAVNNGGTIDLAVTRVTDGKYLPESELISTMAEGGAGTADDPNAIYSNSALTNKAFRVIGFIEISEAAAGAWNTAPVVVQGVGAHEYVYQLLERYKTRVISVAGAASYDFTGIPPWVTRVEITFFNFGTNGSSMPILQLGNDAGFLVSSYEGHGTNLTASATTTSANIDAGMPLSGSFASAMVMSGRATLTKADQGSGIDQWMMQSLCLRTDSDAQCVGLSSVSFPDGGINKIRITTVGGTNTLEGSAAISYTGV